MKILYPDYNNSLVNLSNSILKHYGVKTKHSTLKEVDEYLAKGYKNVVLILYDGFGTNLINQNLGHESFLSQHKIKDITSVFPATTTAATTSLITGLTPAEHCWLGWDIYVESINKTVTMYWNVEKGKKEKLADYSIAEKEFPYTTIFDLINEAKEAKAYCVSPFAGITYNEKNIDEMYSKIMQLCQDDDRKFIYAYCTEPDHTMHDEGTNTDNVINLMKSLEAKTNLFCDNLEDTLVIIVADHGHITAGDYVFLDAYPELKNMLVREISLEARASNFFVKKDQINEFKDAFNKLFADDFILLTKEEVITQKLFGDGIANEKFNSCLGDYIAIAVSNRAILDVYDDHPLKGLHAGLTEDEVLIPLIVIDKKKGSRK